MKVASIPLLASILLVGSAAQPSFSYDSEEGASGPVNRKGCYEFDIYSNALDREEGYQETDFGAVANVPFYDADTNETLGNIQFTQFNMPPTGECYLTTGIFSFLDGNQLTYMFTTCSSTANDIITGGAGDYVGAYGKNSLVEFDFPLVRFKLEFCTPVV